MVLDKKSPPLTVIQLSSLCIYVSSQWPCTESARTQATTAIRQQEEENTIC
jgi:hypothetical protein